MPVAEGKTRQFEDESKIDSSLLEVFAFESPKQFIHTETSEFSAVCPFSGLPDIAKLEIDYKPTGRLCIELKSLKYYLISFREVGIYQEAVTARIYHDLSKILKTTQILVKTTYNTRGGFITVCSEGQCITTS